MTEPDVIAQIRPVSVRYRRRILTSFSGCDYFRLSTDPRVVAAAVAAAREFGLNVAASRMTTGNHPLYSKVEAGFADFFEAQDALLLPSGYLSNLVVAQALSKEFSHVLIDAEAHSALVDAARFFDCPILRFKSRDPQDVARCVRRCGKGARVILLTDGLFARHGQVAPLKGYREVLPHDHWLLVDDAHGAGVLGVHGRGTPEHEGVDRHRLIQTTTLSKAFGAYGGLILGTRGLRQLIQTKSHLFVGSTPLSLPLAQAGACAAGILSQDGSLRDRLRSNAGLVKTALQRAGFPISPSPGPIVSFVVSDPKSLQRLSRLLLKSGIYPPLMRYPGVPSGLVRFAMSSEHDDHHLGNLVSVLVGFLGQTKRSALASADAPVSGV